MFIDQALLVAVPNTAWASARKLGPEDNWTSPIADRQFYRLNVAHDAFPYTASCSDHPRLSRE